MSCNEYQTKYTCAQKVSSDCTYYQETLPEFSKLEFGCVTVTDALKELYDNTSLLLKLTDTSALTPECSNYTSEQHNGEDIIPIPNILREHESKLCNTTSSSSETGINVSGLDLKCMADECNSEAVSLRQVLQVMIDEICNLKTQING